MAVGRTAHARLDPTRCLAAVHRVPGGASPDGFVWAASAGFLGIPVVGFDRLSSGTGQLRWRLAGLVPVMSAGGAEVTRSAAGRLAGEATLVPTTFREATWMPGRDPDTVVSTWQIGPERQPVELRVDARGRLLTVVLQRWGNPGGAPFGRYPFGVAIEEEQTFAGITIPSVLRAAWW